MVDTAQRKPGSKAIAYGLIALVVGVVVFIVVAAVAQSVPSVGDNPFLVLLPLLVALGGLVALAIGVARRLLAR